LIKNLPLKERFILGEIHWKLPNGEKEVSSFSLIPTIDANFEILPAEEALQSLLMDIADRSFKAMKGTGYGRIDMRMKTNEDGIPLTINGIPIIYVLEVNGQCAIGDDSSFGKSIETSGFTIAAIISHLLTCAIRGFKR